MKTISKEILDDIVAGLDPCNMASTGKAFASYEDEDKGILIDASVRWSRGFVDHYITLDGVSYLDFTDFQAQSFSDLVVEAWVDDEQVDIDTDYIYDSLSQYI